MKELENKLQAAIAEIPRELYAAELEEGDMVGDLVTAVQEALADEDYEFAYEELESIGTEFDMSDAFRAHLAAAAELLNA